MEKDGKRRRAFIGLGGNQGDRAALLGAAVGRLAAAAGVRPLRLSGLYETEPWGMPGRPWFLNAVLEVETTLPPRELLDLLLAVEETLGRRRPPTPPTGGAWEDRPVDLDILFYGGETVREAGLSVPHPRLQERAFVLVPLAELAPDLVHPQLDRTVVELLADIRDAHRVLPYKGGRRSAVGAGRGV